MTMKVAKFLAGAMFCTTGAFLYAANHLAAVIYSQKITSWETALGKVGQANKEMGYGLQVVALIFLVVGVFFMYSSANDTTIKDYLPK